MRKRKFKTVTVAALAAMTLTGMNAVPCYAGITLPFIGEIGGSSVKEPELESMLGKSLKEMAGKFDGMSEPYWNMGMTSCSNGQVTLMSADSGDGGGQYYTDPADRKRESLLLNGRRYRNVVQRCDRKTGRRGTLSSVGKAGSF